ncbi:MAG: peptidyl-prolyl cis-trans isomerase D [Rhodothermales bacterium]|jgi:peptidyl-prolyl cis-trans isomerase D
MVLQAIRERLTGVLAFAILGILVVPFALVGVNSYFTTGAENLVARINEKDITVNDFTQSYTEYRRRMQARMGAAFDPEEFDTLVAKREHLDALIDEEILNQAAANMNLDIDDERLAQQIRDIPGFQLDGVFSPDVYQARLTSQQMTVKQFERQIRAQFILSQLPQNLLSSSITTESELAQFVSLLDEKRSFNSILVRPLIEETPAEYDAAEIQKYYDENQSVFESVEMVVLEYLELNALELPAGTEPDEEFLLSRFEDQKGRFISPEQRLVSHILIEVSGNEDEAVITTAKQEAQDVSDRARAGEEFSALALEYSDDIGSSETGGDLGWLEPDVMSDTFEEAMYLLSTENPISDPVQTGFGWHVIQLRDIRPSSGMSFDEARETLAREHQEEEAEREFIHQADLLVDMIYEDPTTLEGAALDLGLEIQQTEPFGRFGGDGIAANPDIIRAAFSELVLLQGSVSDPIDLANNHLVMIKVKEHLPVSVQPLEDVRDQIIAEIRKSRALADARAKADSMLAVLLEEGLSLDEAAEQRGYEVQLVEAAGRNSFVPDPSVVQAVFRLEAPAQGETLSTVVDAQEGYALVVLNSVVPGSLQEGALINEQQYRRQIANSAASIEFTGLVKILRDEAEIDIYEERL